MGPKFPTGHEVRETKELWESLDEHAKALEGSVPGPLPASGGGGGEEKPGVEGGIRGQPSQYPKSQQSFFGGVRDATEASSSALIGGGVDSGLESIGGGDFARILVIEGDSGTGKSRVLRDWSEDWHARHPGCPMLYYRVGESKESSMLGAMLQECIAVALSRVPFLAAGDGTPLKPSYLHEAFKASLHLGPILLVIDGLEELLRGIGATSAGLRHPKEASMDWIPPHLPPNVRVVIGSTPDSPGLRKLRIRHDTRFLTLPSLDECHALPACPGDEAVKGGLAMKEAILMHHCGSIHASPKLLLTRSQIRRLIDAPLSHSARYLSVVGREVGGMPQKSEWKPSPHNLVLIHTPCP